MTGLLDTSVFIGFESGRLQELPTDGAVSVLTLAELEMGIRSASDDTVRLRRVQTLIRVETGYQELPVDRAVASAFAELVSDAKKAGRRLPLLDALIGATAIAAALPVYTQDRDFHDMPGVDVIRL